MALTRRFFVFGTAAAVAAVNIPVAPYQPPPIVDAVITPPTIIFPRFLTELVMSGDATEPGRLMLTRGLDGRPVFDVSVGPHSAVRWTDGGNQMNSFVDLGTLSPIILTLDGAPADYWDVQLFFRDRVTSYVERHFFPAYRGRPVERLPLEA